MKWTNLSLAALWLAATSHASVLLDTRQSGRCGPDGGGAICPGNLCCSTFGYCGDGDTYCLNIAGCQPAYGYCEGEALPSPSPTTTSSSTRSSTTSTPPTSSSTTTIPPPGS